MPQSELELRFTYFRENDEIVWNVGQADIEKRSKAFEENLIIKEQLRANT